MIRRAAERRGRGGAGRALQYALLALAALTLNFAVPRIAPGDPLQYLIGPELATLDAAQQQQVRRELGLDGPLYLQYGRYLAQLARGDLGVSLRYAQPVTSVLADRLPWTLVLLLPALLLRYLVSVVLGLAAARRRGGTVDVALLTGTLFFDALPVFWIALVFLSLFSVRLGWFPAFGAVPLTDPGSTATWIAEVARRAVLPTLTLVIGSLGHTFLLARGAITTTLGEDYVRMAEAKGLSPRRIGFRYLLRNALLPLYTDFALSFGSLVGGAVLVETVFGYPGVGRLVFEAIAARDYPLLQGCFLLIIFGVIAANALADATYPLIDPRVRVGAPGAPIEGAPLRRQP